MLPFAGVIKTLKTVQDNFIIEIIKMIVKKNANEIIGLNTKDQLFREGVNNEDQKLKPLYSNPYKKIKKALNQPTDRVTLKLTGDFHKSFFVQIGNESFRIDAKDEKTKHLVKRYGERVFGLTNSNVDLFQELVVRPDLLKELRRKIIN
tara:strand:- start:113 stop:559 length:447 start_codon:yes stop_codon:yes gene_type:complete